MINRNDTRTDTVVLIFSALAVLIAATLSMATISTNKESIKMESSNPSVRADEAANAGIDAARRHIECHGRIEAGGLSQKYYANGATYTVDWDDVDMKDSTVVIRSLGEFSWGDEKNNKIFVESKIKLEFLPTRNEDILKDYYSSH